MKSILFWTFPKPFHVSCQTAAGRPELPPDTWTLTPLLIHYSWPKNEETSTLQKRNESFLMIRFSGDSGAASSERFTVFRLLNINFNKHSELTSTIVIRKLLVSSWRKLRCLIFSQQERVSVSSAYGEKYIFLSKFSKLWSNNPFLA